VGRRLLAESSEEREMQTRRSFAATGAAAAVVAAGLLVSLSVGAGSARADNPVLTGDLFEDSFVITLADASGAKVKHIDAGTYTLVVHDRSVHHNFHLAGPGVDVATDIVGVGDQTFTITLVDGVYTYLCDPHAVAMRGCSPLARLPHHRPASLPPSSRVALSSPWGRSDLSPRPEHTSSPSATVQRKTAFGSQGQASRA